MFHDLTISSPHTDVTSDAFKSEFLWFNIVSYMAFIPIYIMWLTQPGKEAVAGGPRHMYGQMEGSKIIRSHQQGRGLTIGV